jgi:hypothetical protein
MTCGLQASFQIDLNIWPLTIASTCDEMFATRFGLVGRSPRGTCSDRLFWRTLKGRRLQSVNRSEYHHVRLRLSARRSRPPRRDPNGPRSTFLQPHPPEGPCNRESASWAHPISSIHGHLGWRMAILRTRHLDLSEHYSMDQAASKLS